MTGSMAPAGRSTCSPRTSRAEAAEAFAARAKAWRQFWDSKPAPAFHLSPEFGDLADPSAAHGWSADLQRVEAG